MKNKFLHSFYSVVLTIIVILPFSLQTFHVLEGHQHEVCHIKDTKHFHQHEYDCSIYHQIFQQHSIDFTEVFTLAIIPVFNFSLSHYFQSRYDSILQLKSSRGPPCFIA